jgi:hypothetical protein
MIEKLSKKCIVKGCDNCTHEGQFVGELCRPCYTALVAGRMPRPFRTGYEMRDMLKSMQSGEMTVSRGVELLDMWLAGNFTMDQLPPARNELPDDEMPWDTIDRLTHEVQQATEERDQKDLLLKSAANSFDEAIDCAKLLGNSHAKRGFGCFTEQDASFMRAMYEAIAKYRYKAFGL